MNESPISDNVRQFLSDAAMHFSVGTDLALEDAQAGVRYALERLSMLGLSPQDYDQLGELARRVFEDEESADVRELVEQVKASESASPLAVMIANIVYESGGFNSRKQSMLGAIFGAYAALGSGSIEHACIGAIAGAIAINLSISIPVDRIPLGEGLR